MKKIYTILLLAVLLFNIGGYRLALSHLQSQVVVPCRRPTIKKAFNIAGNLCDNAHNNPVDNHGVNITGIFAKFNIQSHQWSCCCFARTIIYLPPHNQAIITLSKTGAPGKPPNA